MLIKTVPGWALPESAATPESLFVNRRALIKGLAAGSILAGAPAMMASLAHAEDDPTASLYPAPRNDRYVMDRELSAEKDATTYNNFYEFGTHAAAQRRRRVS